MHEIQVSAVGCRLDVWDVALPEGSDFRFGRRRRKEGSGRSRLARCAGYGVRSSLGNGHDLGGRARCERCGRRFDRDGEEQARSQQAQVPKEALV